MWTKYKCVIKQLFEKFLFFDTFKVGLFYKIYQISKTHSLSMKFRVLKKQKIKAISFDYSLLERKVQSLMPVALLRE